MQKVGVVCVLLCQYLRVPSKRVAMVSRKVFWGASSPFITGMMPGFQSQQMFRGKACMNHQSSLHPNERVARENVRYSRENTS